jgi:gamma-glutamylputrescine oxidase
MHDLINERSGPTAVRGSAGHIDSYYKRTARKLVYYPPLTANAKCHVCVVGGGLAGLTTALELARAGTDVMLLEARRVAWGASGRNGGFVSPGFAESIFAVERKVGIDHARSLYRLSVEAVAYIRNLINNSGEVDILSGHGWLKMIRHADVTGLEREAERLMRDYGASLTFLDKRELAQYVATPVYQAGVLDRAPFHIHPLNYASLVARNAANGGARIHENSEVISITREAGGWRVSTQESEVQADHVVLATSVYGGPARRLNAAMQPVGTYVVTAKAPSHFLEEAIRFNGCIGDTRRASDYYRLVGDSDNRQLLWGGRITTRKTAPRRLGQMLLGDIAGVYPQLRELELSSAWFGVMGYAVHKMPLIGRLDAGLWSATGFGGHGLNTSTMAGGLIASALTSHDDRYRLFEPYGLVWAGGRVGAVVAQIEYLRLKLLDWIGERRALARNAPD